ncbi:MAG: hypothetical protein QXO70_02180 [Candidatus Pacearchaeota archaeon]
MNLPLKRGLSFGLTSGVITTLGLIVGLDSSTHSKIAIIGGILTIAIADAFSDAFGIHISEESEKKESERQVWKATFFTFLFKLIFALTFIVPILSLELSTAIKASIAWGLFLLAVFSVYIAKERKIRVYYVVTEHLIIAVIVIFITHYVGDFLGWAFR